MTGIKILDLGRIRGISELPTENCLFKVRVRRGAEAVAGILGRRKSTRQECNFCGLGLQPRGC